MTWVIVVAGLVGIVFVHELGHFGVALLVGMRPRSFYIGFPPALVKIKRRGIEYGIGMIPLGGLVRIPGMHRPAARDLQVLLQPAVEEQPSLAPAVLRVRRALDAEDYAGAAVAYRELDEDVAAASLSPAARRTATRALRDVEEGTAPDAYWRAPTWKRVAVIAAGPVANAVLAFLILWIVFAVSGAPGKNPTTEVAQVNSGTPAAAAGLRPGDRVVGVDGRRTTTFAAISQAIRASGGALVTITVERGGRRVTLVPVHTVRDDQGQWIMGFGFAAALTPQPVGKAATGAASELGRVVTDTGSGLAGLFTSRGRGQISSVIGIGNASAQALRVGWSYYLELLALVSMSLGLLNLLPLLPLDGGHIFFSLIESFRRRALAREVYERVSFVGLALLLVVLFIAVQNDAHRLG